MNSSRNRLLMMEMAFQITSTRTMIFYSSPPLEISIMVAYVQYAANYPVTNSSCIISTTIYHLEGSGFSSAFDVVSQLLKCSSCHPDGPLSQFGQTYLISYSISSSASNPSVPLTGYTITGMDSFSLIL